MSEACTNTDPHGRHEHYGQPATLRRECPGVRENDGHRMVAALEAAGFTILGRGRGYVRMGRPDAASGWWPVPVDDTWPEYAEMLAKVRQVLLADVAQGEAARTALALFDGETS